MADRNSVVEGVRARNLSRVLRIVHRDGPVSRAALTEATKLNRSTIGDLVSDLVDAGLVIERAPGPSNRVGRPSPVVAADPRIVAIAVNPEVDALTIAAVGLDRSIPVRARIERDELLTPAQTAALVAEQLAHWREDPLADARIVAAGVAVPGLVAADGLVRNAPHLLWRDVALAGLLEDALGVPAVIGNDATMGASAEHLFGAARGADDVIYLNGGASGIGGGLVVHGALVTGAGGYAGEFGQNRPGIAASDDRHVAGGYAGEFGQNRPGIAASDDRHVAGGVLEDEVSRARLLAALDLAHADEPTLAAALGASTSSEVAAEVARQRRILSTALANAVNVLNPAVIVLGGFLATLAEQDLEGLTEAVRGQTMFANAEGLVIRPAALAEDRLLIGAAEAAFQSLLSDPIPA